MADKVFVSPGVYTSEREINYVTRQIGVTTLGLVGETIKGPAFQPIFVTNYDEFNAFFGGLNATKITDTGAPKYELPYIAKSYLSQSNQLYVTRILGLSGFDAGRAWGITLSAALNTSTSGTSGTASYGTLLTYTATTAGTMTYVATDTLLQQLINAGSLTSQLAFLATANTGATTSVSTIWKKNGTTFTGLSFTLRVQQTGTTGTNATGTTSGVTTYYSGTSYSDVENKIVALLRSRGTYNSSEVLNFQITGDTKIGFDTTVSAATLNPLSDFSLTANSVTQGNVQYTLSLLDSSRNYITKVLGSNAFDSKSAVYVEELFDTMLDNYITDGKVYGINTTLINYSTEYDDYQIEYQPAVTPYVVSELRGSTLLRLFRFWTISDGNAANSQFKISIKNIKPDDGTFDVVIRAFNDTDARPVILEQFVNCTMDTTSNNYIGRKIGTLDGEYVSKSDYVLVELDDTNDTSTAFPAGFVGYPVRDYTKNSNSTVQTPTIDYKATYGVFENKRKYYLGLSDTEGIDVDFFNYKGVPNSTTIDQWTGMTKGFHMDIDATGATIDGVSIVINSSGGTYSPVYLFETGCCEFKDEVNLAGTAYEKVYSRKFTFAPYGGFDGWDIFRTRRTNTDTYTINGTKGALGLTSGNFANRALSNGDNGTTSDYYAYLEGIWSFNNPKETNINVFATPGIDNFDNTNLIEETIEMIEQDRADSVYIMTTPDTDSAGDIITSETVADTLNGMYDSNYSATYWPWIQILDAENNVNIYVPPTRDVVRNIALTDKIAQPWFATAGLERGDVDAIKARVKLKQGDLDILYPARINPVETFAEEGIKIWGNRNMQIKDSALNRLNVRRLLLQARKLISAVSLRLVFDQNDDQVRNQFLGLVNPILTNIRKERGLTDFRVSVVANTEESDRNTLSAKIFIKPTSSLEFIEIEFVVTPQGASFDNI